jgi:hypothetical protein
MLLTVIILSAMEPGITTHLRKLQQKASVWTYSTNRLSNPSLGIFGLLACGWPSFSEVLTNRSNKVGNAWIILGMQVSSISNHGIGLMQDQPHGNYSESSSDIGVEGFLAESRRREPPRQLLEKRS